MGLVPFWNTKGEVEAIIRGKPEVIVIVRGKAEGQPKGFDLQGPLVMTDRPWCV